MPCFGTGEVLCCVKRSPIGGMRCADGSMDGQKRPSSYVWQRPNSLSCALLVLCTHRVDARDIATPLADVIVVLRTVSSPATGERGMPRSATASLSDG